MKFTIYKCDWCGVESKGEEARRWLELYEVGSGPLGVVHFCSQVCSKEDGAIGTQPKRQFWEIYRRSTGDGGFTGNGGIYDLRWVVPTVKTFDILSWPEGEERND